jgi:hypothetical protein
VSTTPSRHHEHDRAQTTLEAKPSHSRPGPAATSIQAIAFPQVADVADRGMRRPAKISSRPMAEHHQADGRRLQARPRAAPTATKAATTEHIRRAAALGPSHPTPPQDETGRRRCPLHGLSSAASSKGGCERGEGWGGRVAAVISRVSPLPLRKDDSRAF